MAETRQRIRAIFGLRLELKETVEQVFFHLGWESSAPGFVGVHLGVIFERLQVALPCSINCPEH